MTGNVLQSRRELGSVGGHRDLRKHSEFLLEKGFLDAVVHRRELKAYLICALEFLRT